MNIGKAITMCRLQKGLSKTELAEKSGLSTSYITLIEQGNREPNISVINKICLALGIPLSILVFLAADDEDNIGISQELSEKIAHTALSLMKENS